MSYMLIQGDARRIPLADKSVQCIVTSPPYWGLRDYGTATWEGGDGACDHMAPLGGGTQATGLMRDGRSGEAREGNAARVVTDRRQQYRDICGKCGARRGDKQLGLEATPEAYVARMVTVFREVHRILRDDGVCFVNLGDSFSSGGRSGQCEPSDNTRKPKAIDGGAIRPPVCPGLKPKDLVGIPWRVAFALQADGWYLRSDIIWSKPNPMPESVTDRPTKSHEYIFLLTKNERYFWDQEGVREDSIYPNDNRKGRQIASDYLDRAVNDRIATINPKNDRTYPTRNIRSVWTITPKPFAGAHFATFPAELVERCVKAGTSERGACPTCGRCWERVTARESVSLRPNSNSIRGHCDSANRANGSAQRGAVSCQVSTLGFRQACSCPPAAPVPCVVADPFGGAGTVPLVASNLGRVGIAIELSADYSRMARRRIERPHARPERAAKAEYHPLFPERNP